MKTKNSGGDFEKNRPTSGGYYDPFTMPPELRKAHEDNDKAVLKAYGLKPSVTEPEIVQHLFKLYEKLTQK